MSFKQSLESLADLRITCVAYKRSKRFEGQGQYDLKVQHQLMGTMWRADACCQWRLWWDYDDPTWFDVVVSVYWRSLLASFFFFWFFSAVSNSSPPVSYACFSNFTQL